VHELSVTRSLLDQALTEAEKHGAKRISRIRLLLGEGGSVVPDCVQFYFDEMKKGTAAAGAELEFKRVPLRIRCPKCGAEFGKIEEMCTCNAGGEVISGQELVIESIDVD
jgi:hydrogenase nickel incorporation protein HypA/HybF